MKKFKLESINSPLFTTEMQVRINDVNYGNHLGHDNLIAMLHEARVRFLKSLGFSSELDIEGLGVLVTGLIVNYKSEAFYGDKLLISISAGDILHTSFEILYQIKQENSSKEVARAATLISFFDYKNSKLMKIPSSFLKYITNSV